LHAAQDGLVRVRQRIREPVGDKKPEPTSETKPDLTIVARSRLAGPDPTLIFAINVDLRPEALGNFQQPVFTSCEQRHQVKALGDAAGRSRGKSLPSRIQA